MALREAQVFVLLHHAVRHPLAWPMNLIALCA
jgi:hypothetical protein